MKKALAALFCALSFTSAQSPALPAQGPQQTAQDAPVNQPTQDTAPSLPACGAWLLEQLGGTVPERAELVEKLWQISAAPETDPYCKLRALYLWADQTPGDAAEAIYLEGLRGALALLWMRPGWEKVSLKEIQGRLDRAAPSDLPALFWVGYFWGHQIKYISPLKAASQIKQAVALLQRVSELRPELYAGGAPAFIGGYYAELPSFWGRDLDKAAAYFDLAREHAQGNLVRKWTHARALLSKTDAAAYRKALEEIAAAPLDPKAEYYLESFLIQRDAQAALAPSK